MAKTLQLNESGAPTAKTVRPACAPDEVSRPFSLLARDASVGGLAALASEASAKELPRRGAAPRRRSRRPASPAQNAETAGQKNAFETICLLLRAQTTHDFSLYKHSTLYRRIERRMAIHQLDRIADYVLYLRENPQELDLLFKELLIGVTRFFRDPASWSLLAEHRLPQLLAAYPTGSALRAWVAGCSTGEEAYSLAIIFREAQQRMGSSGRHSLQIFATDLDPDAIDQARRGIYPAHIAADVSAERLKRFFVRNGSGYRISKEIREMVVFAPHNVLMDPPFTKLDILSCRNLLIYLGRELQKKLLPLFHYCLKPDGILMLGSVESIGGLSELFSPLEGKACLFQRSSSHQAPVDLEFPCRHLATKIGSPMNDKPATATLQSLADQLLLRQFSPAAVLVNASGDLVYINGRTGNYLEPAAGKVNWNIHAMARRGLRHELALALPEALRSGKPVLCRNLQISTNSGMLTVDLAIRPIDEPAALRGMAMVVFCDVAVATAPPDAVGKLGGSRPREAALAQALAQLEQEKKSLREEMQAAQEEIRTTNEELQSTNEELTTSKEEMHSINERLHTVNRELQSRVDDLSTADNDMKNLLDSTDTATVFLNRALHVRRFTTQATRLFKLIPCDLGRALSDIVTHLVYPGLIDDTSEVLRSLVGSDREVATDDGRWFQVKIMPYRTLKNVIDGVVITCNDISRAKRLEAQLKAITSAKEC